MDSEVGFQEEKGRMARRPVWEASCVVIAEHWPSWTFALHSIGVRELKTVLPVASDRTVKEVLETYVGNTVYWGSGKELLEEVALDGSWKGKLIFIQGSEYFVTSIRNQLKESNEAGMFGIVLDKRRKAGKGDLGQAWREAHPLLVKHSQTGGATHGRWKVLSDYKLTGLKSSQVKHVLANLLVSTESGPPVHASAVSAKDYITKEQRIPPQWRNLRLAVPSCFTRDPNMLVERDISDKELMSAYDVEEGVQRALVAYAKHTNVPLTREYVMEAPLKVLHTVLRLIRNKWDAGAGLGWNQDSKCEDRDGGGKECRGSRKQMRKEKDGEGTPVKQSCQREPLKEGSVKGASQVATKSDDAPADVSDWDIWTVNNYEPPVAVYSKGKANARVMFKEHNPATALICIPGTYNRQHAWTVV